MQTRRFAILVGVLLLLATGVFLAVVLTPSADANPTGGVRAPSAEPKVVRDARRFQTSEPFVIRRHPHHNGRVQHRRFCITPRTCRVVRIQQVVPREARKALAPRRRGGLARAACCGYPYLSDLYAIAASRYVNDNMFRLLRGNSASLTTAYEWPDGGPRQFGTLDDQSGGYQEDRQFPNNGLSWVHFDDWVGGFDNNVMVEVQWVSFSGASVEPTYFTIGSPGLQLVAQVMPDLLELAA